jgi:hypothetical protein
MAGQPTKFREIRVFRRLRPALVLLAALAPALAPPMAHAQTNIDQGKTPVQIFASDCAVCHKAARGLANGRDSLTLTRFLSEHYTSSREQAAALAAYVLGAGGQGRTAAQRRGQKPRPEHAMAPVEEPKQATRHGRRPEKPEERALATRHGRRAAKPEEPAPATRQAKRPAKPEEETPATAKLQRSRGEEVKPAEPPSPVEEPGPANSAGQPAAGRDDLGSAPESRLKPPEALPAAGEPAAVVAAPGSSETPKQDIHPTVTPAPSAAAPTHAAPGPPGKNSPVARDNIPD